ncbi:NAD-dependent epimerase/dehydratase family protein [Rhodococcus rhodochrous]|uniref:NAD-dependent epimerase/dehydratase family protein n=1 Tax=Rhodococcus TaxID=1827 RepID=UPI0002D7503F|nr:SDR family oxidoreductase [Rhodococcus rhodochrous]
MRVLVTGHQGYLGSVLVPILRNRGHEVFGLDNGTFADCTLGSAPHDPPGTTVDIRDVRAEILAGFDAVVHLAALPNDPLGTLPADVVHDVNHRGTVHLARCAKDAGVRRFLYASTCSVYGNAGGELMTENAPRRPLTPYAESKARAEDDLADLADSDFALVFLRCATAFGVSPRMRTDIVLNGFVASAVRTGEIRVPSYGIRWRPLVHVRDIAQAFACALTRPEHEIRCAAVNIGTEEGNVTIREIAESVAHTVPGTTVTLTCESDPDLRSYRVDFSAGRRALPDFVPSWTTAAGVTELYRSHLDTGITRDSSAHRFTRLEYLHRLATRGLLDPTLRPRPIGAHSG